MLVGSVRSPLSSVKKSVLRASSEEKNMEQLTVYSRFMLAGRRGREREGEGNMFTCNDQVPNSGHIMVPHSTTLICRVKAMGIHKIYEM